MVRSRGAAFDIFNIDLDVETGKGAMHLLKNLLKIFCAKSWSNFQTVCYHILIIKFLISSHVCYVFFFNFKVLLMQ